MSSVSERRIWSVMRLTSGEAASKSETVMSVTRNTTHSAGLLPSAMPAASFAVWNTASITLGEMAVLRLPERLRPNVVCTGRLSAAATSASGVPALELVGHLGRLRAQALGDLVVAPALLDLRAHVVEAALARGRDAGHVEPDIAAARNLQRLGVDADVGARTPRRSHRRRSAGRRPSCRRDRARSGRSPRMVTGGEAELLRDLGKAQPAAALVLDLVVARRQARCARVRSRASA